ncbi:GNAT family N-acetyltransferase [Bacillus timonensis]|nr:GNAT family N-acetyltransferase [Bacillus timonensis]
MMRIEKVESHVQKSTITNDILRQLPEWFGIEEAIVNYVKGVEKSDVYVAFDDDKPVGMISLISHNLHTSEIYVMGVLKEYHNQGIGMRLIEAAEKFLIRKNTRYLMVKTLGESHPDLFYKKTRNFYEKAGFFPLEEIKEIWGEANPCLIMVKNL